MPGLDAFTLAHLSDPHLTSLVAVRPRQIANKRILGYLSWRQRRRFVHRTEVLDRVVDDLQRQRPDHIAVTGDLTHIGLPAECRDAAAWLGRLGDPAAVTVVPGNHDRYVADDPDSTVGLWRAYRCGDDGSDAAPFLRRRGAVALIGVDDAVPTAPFLATGEVGAVQREGLARLLRRTGAEGLFRVVLLHHSPLPGADVFRKRLRDATAVLRILRDCGAELVIHGHGHIARIDRLTCASGSPMLVVAVPSASHSRVGRAGWNRYRISGSPGAWQLDIEARRTSADGVIAEQTQAVTWGNRVSRAAAPSCR